MSKANLFNVDLVRIDNIVIQNARLDNNTEISILEKKKFSFEITHSFGFGVSRSENKMRVVFSCEIAVIDKSTQKKIDINSNFDIQYFFVIDNLNELVGPEPEGAANPFLIVSLANIAYSTSRGIIFTRCQGTIMKSLVLPIISTKSLDDMFRSKGGSIKESRHRTQKDA